jgi:hypothetical protein
LGGSCAIGNKFQLVILKDADPDYTTPIENNAGYVMHVAPADEAYLGNGLTFLAGIYALALKDDSGMLDGALAVVDWRDVSPENGSRAA